MANISEQGISATSRSDYITLLNARFRAALGNDLDVSSPTPQGQLIGVLADTLSEVDQAIISQANSHGLTSATGRQLDDLASQLGLTRRQATFSTVTATLTGVAMTHIRVGALAATTSGDVFANTTGGELVDGVDGIRIGTGGTVDVVMRAQRSGPVAVAVNALSRVITRISGWDSVTNAAAATVGRDVETDAALRSRYRAALGRTARTTLAAVMASINDVDSVTAHRVFVNDTASELSARVSGGVTIPANSILAIVDTSPQNTANDLLVATAILASKSLGVSTSGNVSVMVESPWGQEFPVQFQRPTDIPISVTLRTNAGLGFPTDGVQQITSRLVEYVAALGIGDGVTAHALDRPAYQVPGHEITSITVARRPPGSGGVGSGDIDRAERLTLAAAHVSIPSLTG